ncbi:MAG: hypothetical protein IH820_04240 [Bacteroidetes bacterium]|nr:hypothetical protein [Bacteroidota bacterium]
MFHPYAIVTGVFPEGNEMETWKGPQGNIFMSQEFYESDPKRDFVRGYSFQIVRGSGPAWLARGGFADAIPWGEGHHEEFARQFGKTMALAVIGEDLPELHNEVVLDPDLVDGAGIPAPRVNYTLSVNSRSMLDDGIANGRKVFEAAGAVVVKNPALIGQTVKEHFAAV